MHKMLKLNYSTQLAYFQMFQYRSQKIKLIKMKLMVIITQLETCWFKHEVTRNWTSDIWFNRPTLYLWAITPSKSNKNWTYDLPLIKRMLCLWAMDSYNGLYQSWTDNLARAKRMLCQLELTAQCFGMESNHLQADFQSTTLPMSYRSYGFILDTNVCFASSQLRQVTQ